MSLMPVMWGKSRGWTCCAASTLTICETPAGISFRAISLPPAIQMTAITITTTPGSTVPIKNPFEVMPEMADVPRRVTSVAHQYIAIENNPTYSPFCASAGTPIM